MNLKMLIVGAAVVASGLLAANAETLCWAPVGESTDFVQPGNWRVKTLTGEPAENYPGGDDIPSFALEQPMELTSSVNLGIHEVSKLYFDAEDSTSDFHAEINLPPTMGFSPKTYGYMSAKQLGQSRYSLNWNSGTLYGGRIASGPAFVILTGFDLTFRTPDTTVSNTVFRMDHFNNLVKVREGARFYNNTVQFSNGTHCRDNVFEVSGVGTIATNLTVNFGTSENRSQRNALVISNCATVVGLGVELRGTNETMEVSSGAFVDARARAFSVTQGKGHSFVFKDAGTVVTNCAGLTLASDSSAEISGGVRFHSQAVLPLRVGNASSGSSVRIAGKGTDARFVYSVNHANNAAVYLGYGTKNDGTVRADDNELVVEDGAHVSISASPSITSTTDCKGLVIGGAYGVLRNKLRILSGAVLTNELEATLGHSKDWGGGSCGLLQVSNATFVTRKKFAINASGGTCASCSNRLEVLDGASMAVAGSLTVGKTAYTGAGVIDIRNATLTSADFYVKQTQYPLGPNVLRIGGTNGVYRMNIFHANATMADPSATHLNLVFGIPAEGRDPSAGAALQMTYAGDNTLQTDGVKMHLEIDPDWACSGRRNSAALVKLPANTPAACKERLVALAAAVPAVELVNGCRLAVEDKGLTLRLYAGPRRGLLLLLR